MQQIYIFKSIGKDSIKAFILIAKQTEKLKQEQKKKQSENSSFQDTNSATNSKFSVMRLNPHMKCSCTGRIAVYKKNKTNPATGIV